MKGRPGTRASPASLAGLIRQIRSFVWVRAASHLLGLIGVESSEISATNLFWYYERTKHTNYRQLSR